MNDITKQELIALFEECDKSESPQKAYAILWNIATRIKAGESDASILASYGIEDIKE